MADLEMGQSQEGERLFRRKDFAVAERLLLGSTEQFKEESIISLTWLIDKKTVSGSLDPDLFRVPNVDISSPDSLDQVNKLRRGQRYKQKRIMPFLDIEKQLVLSGHGISVGLVLGDAKPDGTAGPKWQLILIDNDDVEIEDENSLIELKLTSRSSEGFELQLEDGKLFLALKP